MWGWWLCGQGFISSHVRPVVVVIELLSIEPVVLRVCLPGQIIHMVPSLNTCLTLSCSGVRIASSISNDARVTWSFLREMSSRASFR